MAGVNPLTKTPAGWSSDFILHVYDSDYGVVTGRVSHIQSGRTMIFHSMLEMLLAVQAKMDELNHPQASTTQRSWSSRPQHPGYGLTGAYIDPETSSDKMPEAILASFLLRVQFRQNTSWQGTLVWMERKESCAFRSVLELMILIAAALSGEPAAAEDNQRSIDVQMVSDI